MSVSVPTAAPVFLILLIFMPSEFGNRQASSPSKKAAISGPLKKIDFIGVILLLAASFLLVAALLGASTTFEWSSPTFIVLLVLSLLSWVAFIWYERRLSTRDEHQEEIFPWRFVENRLWMGTLL